MKGTKTITVEVGTVVVTVECDEEEGYDGDINDLNEDVTQTLRDEIEGLAIESGGWMSTDLTVKALT